jgi:hypothetical protein
MSKYATEDRNCCLNPTKATVLSYCDSTGMLSKVTNVRDQKMPTINTRETWHFTQAAEHERCKTFHLSHVLLFLNVLF